MGVGLGQGKKAEPRLGRRWRQLTIAAASLDNDFGAKLGRGKEQLAPVNRLDPKNASPVRNSAVPSVPLHSLHDQDTDTAR